ncbi:NSP (nuclear shuttle protein)-interacting GTPase [Zea mays]|uniref:NSP (Nuclear shuttle protein)-interacting GTPase n=1 Tax=Zea mays TaxID=4577 RepID=A0A1D6H7F6_MAIZE|nr:NSP (nuclear shuttle protein)-interacting GTPase [Zea mays]AQK70701.1 NSP (nuclear shuttle protein)-interacting GTPase [Zea mays]AQK70704.1 NSP (nuclear shuttle protein)-interacting GTPase [Zea mays]
MASRVKEDERHEKILRGLLKLPANKRCINCNNLKCLGSGIFWTTICLHKFLDLRLYQLQWSTRAREVFFKEWDPQRNGYPDSSNADKLRNFIKHVYVERRYTGERSTDKPPRAKDDKDEYSENRRSDGNWGGSRSPPDGSYSDRRSYSGRSDDRNSRYSYGDRSPGYDQNDYKKSPRYFEVVDDRSGKTTPVQRFEDRWSSEPRKPDSGSPDFQKEADGSSPVVRPVRDILGDNTPQLRVGEPSKPATEPPKPSVVRPIDPPKPSVVRPIGPPKPNGTRAIDPPPLTKTISSASSIGSSEGTSEQTKVASAVSLIDFSADPEPASTAPPQPTPMPQQPPFNAAAPQPILEQGKSDPSVSGGDWASFDSFGQQQTPQTSSSVNPLESALAQLSFSEAPSAPNASAYPVSLDPTLKANDGGHSSVLDQSHSLFDAPFGISGNQASTVMSGQGSSVQQSPLAAPTAGPPSQATANPQGTSGIQGAASSTDSKFSSRKELPVSVLEKNDELMDLTLLSNGLICMSIFDTGQNLLQDIFTALYPPSTQMMPGWQRAPHFGMGYAMQYPPGVGLQSYLHGAFPQPTYQQPVYSQHAYSHPQPVKASNPFDLGNESAHIQAHMPPSGPPGASAGSAPQTLIGNSSFGVPPQQPHQLYQSEAHLSSCISRPHNLSL